MQATARTLCTAFEGFRKIGSGELAAVAPAVWHALQAEDHPEVLVYDDATGHLVDFDFYGSLEDVLERLEMAARWASEDAKPKTPRGRGRPKLGVVAREVTLLPRHWAWLDTQPGGASAALRRLVEEAKRISGPADRVRQSQEAAYRFMSDMAGDLVGFEEASRALFAADIARFDEMSATWPSDVRDYIKRLGADAFAPPPPM
ncbi:DUF2239 family protein [Blastopirellula sp. JC732]|uniref:DUF2239 family protein n=1 Tax=Blastopirellula sediminis TaxID=2894196 RepID=A0A9X1SER4_9BACT|nr:DUF2239 family protein [Blastopirellula sediminis]MCC9604311.1 DUF2239 family protein [Blastopirellula sediminis]MCC9626831.1 DUF2239 family protein [Blastopirellula sediminis]